MYLYKIILPPSNADLESSHKAGFLHYALIIAAVAFLLFGLLNLGWGAYTLGAALLLFFGFCIIGIILNKQKYYYLAATLLTSIIYIGIFINLVDGAALHDPGIAALPIFILVTGFLYKKEFIPLLSFLSILGVFAIYFFWTQDLILLNKNPTLNRVIILSILQVMTGFLAWIISSTYQNIISDLNTSKERFHKVFMASPYSIIITRDADNTIVDVNEGFERNTGYSRSELIGRTLVEVGLIKDAKISEQMQDLIADQGYIRDLEIDLVHKNGQKLTSLFSSEIIEINDEPHIVSIGMDVTRLRKSEQALQESDLRNSLILESLPMAFYRATPYGEYGGTWVSEQIDQVAGFSPEEMVDPEFWSSRLHPDDRDMTLGAFDGLVETKSLEIEYRWQRADGEYIWVQDNAILLKDDAGVPQEIIGTWTDISERKLAENEIRESEEKFHKVFMSIPYSMTIARNKDGILVDVNEWFEKSLGYSREEAIGRTAMDLGLPKDPKVLEKMVRIVADEGRSSDIEMDLICKDGREITSLISSIGIELKGESHRVTLGKDITDLKESERALVESELRYRTLYENANDAIFIIKGDRVIDCNNLVQDMFGYTKKEIIGKHPGEISPPKQPDGQESISKAEAFNQKVSEGYPQLFDWVHRHKDGSEFTAEVNLHQIVVHDEALTLAVVRDITDRKVAEQALHASEDRYRTLFDHTVEGIAIMKGEEFIDVNATWLNIFSLTRGQVIGQTPFDFSPQYQPDGQKSQDKGREYIARALDGEPQQFEWEHTRADGTDFDAEIFLTVIELSGEEVILGLIRDLTERKQAEDAARDERQRLARDLHDAVSQTLFSASVIAQTLERSWDHNPELVRENLVELHILTQGALAEMRTLLYELRPAALEHTLMTELLQQLVDGFSGRTRADIDLSITGENPLPYEVRLTLFRLGQEVLSNIIKHARAEHVKVFYDSQPGEVRLIIDDDGRGFDLTNVDISHHGLEIMRERANAINADLVIQSQPGKGTKIEVLWQEK